MDLRLENEKNKLEQAVQKLTLSGVKVDHRNQLKKAVQLLTDVRKSLDHDEIEGTDLDDLK